MHPTYKTKYHVGNWPAYDRALVQRGDITLWFAPEALATREVVGAGTRGGQLQNSDLAIETTLTLRGVVAWKPWPDRPWRVQAGHTTGMKSKVHPKYKTRYRVANWPTYNEALVRRGDVTLWLAPEGVAAWTPRRSGTRGGQQR